MNNPKLVLLFSYKECDELEYLLSMHGVVVDAVVCQQHWPSKQLFTKVSRFIGKASIKEKPKNMIRATYTLHK